MYGSTTVPPKIVTTASHTSGVPRPVASYSSLPTAATTHSNSPIKGYPYKDTVEAIAAPARKCACLSMGMVFIQQLVQIGALRVLLLVP